MTFGDRFRGGLWGLFVGDALAMPVHWYYDVAALQRDFGTLATTRRRRISIRIPSCPRLASVEAGAAHRYKGRR